MATGTVARPDTRWAAVRAVTDVGSEPNSSSAPSRRLRRAARLVAIRVAQPIRTRAITAASSTSGRMFV